MEAQRDDHWETGNDGTDFVAVGVCTPGTSGGAGPARGCDTRTPVTRAREYTAADEDVQDEDNVYPITERVRRAMAQARKRARTPAPLESDGMLPHPKTRSPITEDHPSMRCILHDYRKGARDFGDGVPAAAALYWAIAVLPLIQNMLAALLHIHSQRPGRWWAVVLIGVIIAVIAIH